MATALTLAADGKRRNGRWQRNSLPISENSQISGWNKALHDAGVDAPGPSAGDDPTEPEQEIAAAAAIAQRRRAELQTANY